MFYKVWQMVIKLRLINCAINGTHFHLKLTVFARRMKEWMIVLLISSLLPQSASVSTEAQGLQLSSIPLIQWKRTVIYCTAPSVEHQYHVIDMSRDIRIRRIPTTTGSPQMVTKHRRTELDCEYSLIFKLIDRLMNLRCRQK